jgi:alpha-beta hydrolase superfamily lysophospholipase
VIAHRVSWRVAPSGRYAACTLLRPGTAPALEIRTVGGVQVHAVPNLGPTSQLLATDNGVWMCHHRDSRHLIERLDADGTPVAVAASDAQGLALVAADIALEFDAAGTSRVLSISDGVLREIATLAGPAVGGVPLRDGRLSVDVVTRAGHCSAVEVDTATGAISPLFEVSARSDDRVVDYLAAENLVVVSTDATGDARLGVGRPGEEPVRFPDALRGPGAAMHLATSGERLAVAFEAGARSLIRIVDLATDQAVPLRLPPLVVLGRGALNGDTLVVPVSTPDRPATLLRIDLTGERGTFDDPAPSAVPSCDVLALPGHAGVIESVVVGDVAQARDVVIALHGGPLDAWRAMYDPLLVGLASAGIAVVAPNIRGSVGYGPEHARAIIGAWGGPDLDDVRAVADAVTKLRAPDAKRPALLGISYGAWLALLAAQRFAARWDACVALSPFLSGARVAADAGPVAELVRRLGGTSTPDLRDRLGAMTAPLLVLHGEGDDVVPVTESLELRRALGPRGDAVRILPGVGHDLLSSNLATDVVDDVVAFLRPVAGPPGDAASTKRERRGTT